MLQERVNNLFAILCGSRAVSEQEYCIFNTVVLLDGKKKNTLSDKKYITNIIRVWKKIAATCEKLGFEFSVSEFCLYFDILPLQNSNSKEFCQFFNIFL